ncbi:hypothetical protein jhhlp_002042 [Lomentospora prolificans]|uniref:ribonuclease Z n=1 Tax=Lomentospora prolificans TaxID=41688 RepID=A0A2N3NCY8_9PEZI|nr:hypothetical protein jhhlp_002042 [Lomentospora prolificans]
MTSHVEIVTTPTADTAGATLYVHFDKRRYLIGRLSEGVQRAFNQRKMAASSLEQIFVTGEVGWDTVGGMMGLLLTVSDVVAGSREALAEQNRERRAKGRAEITKDVMERLDIHGAENLTYSLATARNFIFRTGMPFRTYELLEDRRLTNGDVLDPDWEDDCLRVWKVPLYKQSPSKRRRRDDDGNAGSEESSQSSHKRQNSQERRALSDLVESMFNSNWRLDALVPSKLHKVVLPAKIFVRGDNGSIQRYTGPLPGDAENVPDIDVLVREPWPATRVHTLPQTHQSSQSMCYLVKNHSRRGKFKANVAKELGVKPSDNKKLVDGQTVPGKDGPVTPDMVLEPPIKGNGFVVIDIPDPVYIDSFLSRPEWTNAELMDGVGVIYWILGKDLISAPEVQAFIRERPNLKHIMLTPDTCPDMIAFESHANLTAKLQRIDPDRFPPLWYNNATPKLGTSVAPFLPGRTGKRVKTMPQLQIEDVGIVDFCNPAEAASKINDDVLELATMALAKVSDSKFQLWLAENERDIPNRDAEITPLGTGSALPSKYRNVSATLIRIPGYGSYLLDCGENTLGQMRRAYGYEETAQILSELRCIFISHMHADHHLGTMSVIAAWQKESQGKSVLSICCTDYMRRFIEEYSQVQPVNFANIRFYGDDHSDINYTKEFEQGDPSGLTKLERVRVDHCKSAHAGILTWSSGLKIAYSGDCRPSNAFAEKAKGATLLIHEATFEDDKAGDAQAKKHSTMSEALGVAEKMQAKRVLLTHFSQRYAKLPASEDKGAEDAAAEDKPVNDRVVLNAFDQMRVKLGDFRKAEAFLPAILKLLEEDSK